MKTDILTQTAEAKTGVKLVLLCEDWLHTHSWVKHTADS